MNVCITTASNGPLWWDPSQGASVVDPSVLLKAPWEMAILEGNAIISRAMMRNWVAFQNQHSIFHYFGLCYDAKGMGLSHPSPFFKQIGFEKYFEIFPKNFTKNFNWNLFLVFFEKYPMLPPGVPNRNGGYPQGQVYLQPSFKSENVCFFYLGPAPPPITRTRAEVPRGLR